MNDETATPAPAPAPPVTRFGWMAYGLAAVVIVLDQLSKFWILRVYDLPAKGSVAFAPFFSLTMEANRGVSFGLLKAEVDLARWGLVLFSLAVAVALGLWARKSVRLIPAIALGLVIGGALGNVIDRVRFGAVTDFLDFSGLHFPWIFNVADSGITVGVALLLLDSLIGQRET